MNARLVVVMMAIALSGMVGASEKRWMCPQMEMELFRVHAMRDDVEYEDFHGHKLDRKLLDLLRRY